MNTSLSSNVHGEKNILTFVLYEVIVQVNAAAFSAYERVSPPRYVRLIILQHTYHHLDLSLVKVLGKTRAFHSVVRPCSPFLEF